MRTLTLQPRYHRHGYVQPFLSDRELSPAVAIIGAAHPPYDLERLDAGPCSPVYQIGRAHV